jgi:hypothetical protein
MKLRRKHKILLSSGIIIISWLMIGIGYTTKISLLQNLFWVGLLLIFTGIVLFLLAVNSK